MKWYQKQKNTHEDSKCEGVSAYVMRRDVCILLCFLLVATFPILISSWQRGKITQLYSKSRMPKFNDDDEEELKRITSGVVPFHSLLIAYLLTYLLTYSSISPMRLKTTSTMSG